MRKWRLYQTIFAVSYIGRTQAGGLEGPGTLWVTLQASSFLLVVGGSATHNQQKIKPVQKEPTLDAFELHQLLDQRSRIQRAYLEFLRVPSLSAGVYVLPAGGIDTQQPHTEDEVYYIASGRGIIQVDGENRDVAAGSVVFVKAGDEH